MAIWQFEVSLHPSRARSVVPGLFEPPPGGEISITQAFDAILPRRESWADDLLMWGDEDGHRVHAIAEGGRIVETTARIDLRQPSMRFIAQLIAIARAFDAAITTDQGSAVVAEPSGFLEAIRASEASRFVRDPGQFLEGIKPETTDAPGPMITPTARLG